MQLKSALFEEISLLIEPEEMELFFSLLSTKEVINAKDPLLSREPQTVDFMEAYQKYVAALKEHTPWDPKEAFHARIVTDKSAYSCLPVASHRWVVSFHRPPISMKHTTAILGSDGQLKFHVFGKERLFLGCTFQYPRIYEGVSRVAQSTVGLPEFEAFREWRRFARNHTFPLKFRGVPIEVRVSEKSLCWVRELPGFRGEAS